MKEVCETDEKILERQAGIRRQVERMEMARGMVEKSKVEVGVVERKMEGDKLLTA